MQAWALLMSSDQLREYILRMPTCLPANISVAGMAAEDKVQQLRTLIQAAATEKQMPQARVELLNNTLGLLVENDLIDAAILGDTTEEQFATIVGTLGAAKVLKMLFPSPSAGASAC